MLIACAIDFKGSWSDHLQIIAVLTITVIMRAVECLFRKLCREEGVVLPCIGKNLGAKDS